ncbi:hypothetical protein ACKX2L_06495 [Lachnospiraceae bacterium YH-ros2228]
MPKVRNKLLYYAHRKYGKDITVRKEEDGVLRFWTEFYAITLTLTPDGKVEEKVRKREGTSAKQYFDGKAKPKTNPPVKARKKVTVKKTVTRTAPKKKSEKVTAKAKTPVQEPKREKAVTPKATKRCTRTVRTKLRPGDVVKSIYCDDLYTILSNEGDGIVRVAAGQVSQNDAKYHSEYLMTQYDLTELHRKGRTQ